MSEGALLFAVISDPQFHLSDSEIAEFSRRLVERVRSPLVSPWNERTPPALWLVDLTRYTDPSSWLQLSRPGSQLLEVSIHGSAKPWGTFAGYGLLAEWLRHHIACDVYLGGTYGGPLITLDRATIDRMNKSFIRDFCEDTRGSWGIGLPCPESASARDRAVIAARFRAARAHGAIESLIEILDHRRGYEGDLPIPADGPSMAIFDVARDPPSSGGNSMWQPQYRPDDPTFAIPHAHRFAVIPTTLDFANATDSDAWPFTRFFFEVLTFLGGEPVYGTADERDPAKRPKLLSSEEAARLTSAYLDAR
jgi:hypothetical protein